MAFSLVDLLRDGAERRPERIALELDGLTASYGELWTRAQAVASVLCDDGMRRGERVALLADRSFDSYAGIFGIMLARGIYVPLNSAAPPAQQEAIIEDCGIGRVVTDPGHASAVAALPPGLRLVIGSPHAPPGGRALDWADVAAAGASSPGALPIEQDPCLIFFTSGSTGRPKGVVHSHRSMLANVEWAVRTFDLSAEDRFSNVTSHHFDLCWLEMYASLAAGGTIRIAPEETVRFPGALAAYYRGSGTTIWCSVPSTLMQLSERGGLIQDDLADLRWILFAGERFPTKNLKTLMRQLPKPDYCNMYGTSETHIAAYLPLPPVDLLPDEPLPIGRGCEHVELQIFRADGEVAADGEVGELAIRGPSVMEGYWQLPERNAVVLRSHAVGDGAEAIFYHSGDLAFRRPDGVHEIVGRGDRRVKVSGVFVDLDEVEAVLLEAAEVRECAAFQPRLGEPIQAVAVPAEGSAPSAPALRAAVARRLPVQAVPQRIAIVDDLPRTGSAKISRAEVPAWFDRHIGGGPNIVDGGRAAALRRFLVDEVLREPLPEGFGDGDDLLESGRLASMDVMRLVAFLEDELGLPLTNDEFTPDNFVSIETMTRLIARLEA